MQALFKGSIILSKILSNLVPLAGASLWWNWRHQNVRDQYQTLNHAIHSIPS